MKSCHVEHTAFSPLLTSKCLSITTVAQPSLLEVAACIVSCTEVLNTTYHDVRTSFITTIGGFLIKNKIKNMYY